MTELNIAYNTTDIMGDDLSKGNEEIDYQQQSPIQQTQPQIQIQPQPQPIIQPQLHSQQQQQPQQSQMNNFYMPQQQPTMRKQYQLPQRTPEYSFWDRMTMSRPDVFKLILLSFVIVLGISIEKFASYYINLYLTDNIMSTIQELLIRLSYPILIFLFIWIIKSL
jgi:ABC-type bacteriocin/lantibiotic exporter with double-glycine peptidase domain